MSRAWEIGKIGKSRDDSVADAQGFMDEEFYVFHFLHTLVQDDIVKRLVGKIGQAGFNVSVIDAQALFYAFIDRRLAEFDSLYLGPRSCTRSWRRSPLPHPRSKTRAPGEMMSQITW